MQTLVTYKPGATWVEGNSAAGQRNARTPTDFGIARITERLNCKGKKKVLVSQLNAEHRRWKTFS